MGVNIPSYTGNVPVWGNIIIISSSITIRNSRSSSSSNSSSTCSSVPRYIDFGIQIIVLYEYGHIWR